jgi:hypothetical protein
MNITCAVIASLLLFAVGVSFGGDVPLACNLKAISASERPHYMDLMKRLRLAVHDRSELPDGYTYKLDRSKMPLPEVAEWITMEQLCCPFLRFNLEVNGKGDSSLTLRGPSGAKAILEEEFRQKVK